MSPDRSVQTRRVPALDGLRALAVALVVFDHLSGWFVGGGVGVGIFFVLSGFLITSLLVEESERSGTIRLGRFYLRRSLRLYPPLLAMLAVTAAFMHPTAEQVIAPSTYSTNLLDWFGYAPGVYGQTWSLGLEEQFYLLWPLLLPVVLGVTRRTSASVLVVLAIAAHVCGQIGFAFGLPAHNPLATYNPIWQGGAIMIGCALALATRGGTWKPSHPRLLVVAGVSVCLAAAIVESISLRYGFLIGILPELASAGLIIGLIHTQQGVARMFAWPLVVWAGRRSYAIYLWHFPLIRYAYSHGWGGRGAVAMVFVTVAAAELSWRLIEAPIARLKTRQAQTLTAASRPRSVPLNR